MALDPRSLADRAGSRLASRRGIHRSAAFACLVVCGGCAVADAQSARFIVEHEWAGRGQWVAADLHVHTRFSDGANTVDQVVDRAQQFGCGAIAITDHADRGLKAATAEYQAAIEAARAANPDLVILGGLEWNVPPHGGDEHATLIVPPDGLEWSTLAEFKDRFDDYELGDRPKPDAAEALEWLAGRYDGRAGKPVVVYNHPSRKDAASLDNVADLEAWRAVNDLVVGFEGAPGHQGDRVIGSYTYQVQTTDRWDPAAAEPGDAWDTLLQRAIDVHGALAASDFHNANPRGLNDYWPCQFSETWLYVSERTPAGVLGAVRAGTFFGAHGRIAREVELTAAVNGLPRPAVSGETIEVPAGTSVAVSVRFSVPARDWNDQPSRIDAVEFIVITPAEVRVISKAVTGTASQAVSDMVPAGTAGFVVRARGRRAIADGPDLMFYTNAIRIMVGRPAAVRPPAD